MQMMTPRLDTAIHPLTVYTKSSRLDTAIHPLTVCTKSSSLETDEPSMWYQKVMHTSVDWSIMGIDKTAVSPSLEPNAGMIR